MAELVVRSWSWRQWPAHAATWERIHAACPDASFFLATDWVDNWITTFGKSLAPEILMFEDGDQIVGCCLVVWRTQWVRGIPVRRAFLNCSGEDERDSTCIEYNALLCLPGASAAVTAALARFLGGRYWDELVLDGVSEGGALASLTTPRSKHTVVSHRAPYVDLGKLRRDGVTLDSVLSANTRQQIHRSQRLFEKELGACTLHVAETRDEALEIFDRLAGLHQKAWADRGRPGVFASPRFTRFHRHLIERLFDRDRIWVGEARAGTSVIGALYSFVYRGRLYFYQSGFRYLTDPRLKPGIVTHYLAIRHCLEHTALAEYDFLAGDSQYKRSFATASRGLQWIVVTRPTASMLLLRALRLVKRGVERAVG